MNKKKLSLLVSLLALVSLACVLTIPVPGVAPTAPPSTPLETSTDQPETQSPAPTTPPTSTETPLPTLLPSATLTFFPTITPIPTETVTPSITPTFLPIVLTLGPDVSAETMTVIASTPASSGDPIGSNYSCILVNQKFADNTVLAPKYRFSMWWELTNAGIKDWNTDMVILSLVEGKKLSSDRTKELPFDVSPGQTVRAQIEMETPKEPGTYAMTWGLKDLRGNRHFCFFSLTIIVKK